MTDLDRKVTSKMMESLAGKLFFKLRQGASMGRFCWLDGWMVCWLLEKSVENFQTKTTTGAYCAPALL